MIRNPTNPIFNIDFYKVGHFEQYPSDTTQVWSNWTPRKSRVLGLSRVANVGFTYFAKKHLLEDFNQGFFNVPEGVVLSEYKDVVSSCLGVKSPRVDHIQALHRLGYLPIKVYALPEGHGVPFGVPALVITNTRPEAFWLPNYLETLLSAGLWRIATSATTAQRYRRIFEQYAKEAGEEDLGFVDWQGHDFSCRGMGGIEDAIQSGLGHLFCFSGTDTVPAVVAAKQYYGAKLTIGGSVPATEHSVMSAGLDIAEFETFERLLFDVYPTGILSIVSDTWDLWKVLTDYVPRLKGKILARQGKLVIRPDSGDPVDILCGDDSMAGHSHSYKTYRDHPAFYGAIQLLATALGTDSNRQGLPLIKNGGLIYGDSITPERADAILSKTVHKLHLSPYNVVLGIGSYTYCYVTRDTYGFAMKATAVRRGGEILSIFKKPVTDDGTKFSLKGIPVVYRTEWSTPDKPIYYARDMSTEDALEHCALEKVFEDGKLLVDVPFDTVRERVIQGCRY